MVEGLITRFYREEKADIKYSDGVFVWITTPVVKFDNN